MTNKYPGTCTECSKQVEAGEGTCLKVGKRWAVKHADCATATEKPRSFKQIHGRCEDAPCCGCCGQNNY